jgi:hypothetical protein
MVNAFREKEQESKPLKPVVRISLVPFPPQEIFPVLKSNLTSSGEAAFTTSEQADMHLRIVKNVQEIQKLQESHSDLHLKHALFSDFKYMIRGISQKQL